jgi:hypothetical protein
MAKAKKATEEKVEKKEKKAKQIPTRKQLDDAPDRITGEDIKNIVGDKRVFEKSGSTGWYISDKVVIKGLRCQVSCSVVIIGSKHTK